MCTQQSASHPELVHLTALVVKKFIQQLVTMAFGVQQHPRVSAHRTHGVPVYLHPAGRTPSRRCTR